jgi:hypothetical protein
VPQNSSKFSAASMNTCPVNVTWAIFYYCVRVIFGTDAYSLSRYRG